MLQWVKDELTNTNVLLNLDKHCDQQLKVVYEELNQKVAPSLVSSMQLASRIRAILKAKSISQIASLGFLLKTVEDVIKHLQEASALTERLSLDVIRAKKDTRALLRFLNSVCIEQAGETTIDNALNELSKAAPVKSSQILEIVTRSEENLQADNYLLLEHINLYFEKSSDVEAQTIQGLLQN